MPECKLLPVLGSPDHQQCVKLGVPSSVELKESKPTLITCVINFSF